MNMPSHAKDEEELMRNDTKANIAGASTLDTSEKCSYSTRFTTRMSYFSNLKILSENLVCFDHAFNSRSTGLLPFGNMTHNC